MWLISLGCKYLYILYQNSEVLCLFVYPAKFRTEMLNFALLSKVPGSIPATTISFILSLVSIAINLFKLNKLILISLWKKVEKERVAAGALGMAGEKKKKRGGNLIQPNLKKNYKLAKWGRASRRAKRTRETHITITTLKLKAGATFPRVKRSIAAGEGLCSQSKL